MKKKNLIASFLAAALLLGLSACSSSGETAAVQKVSLVAGTGSIGLVEQYAGVVVSGQTAEIKKDENKKVLELRVAEGDNVSEGDVLFVYDTEAMELSLAKLRLELEQIENSILTKNQEIEQLENASRWLSAAAQLEYTLQIDSLRADIREAEYNRVVKQRELTAMEESMEDTEVRAPISGRVMSITESNDSEPAYYGEGTPSNAYITIMDMSTFQIKGNINELNLYSLTAGMPVLIRSRIDSQKTWTGTVEMVDWENPVDNSDNNRFYYYASDEMTTSTKYPFYITPDSMDDMILGLHVYIEPDYGQSAERGGLWLPSYFLNWEESGEAWVWAANSRDRLEKRSVELGEYDEGSDRYEILSGLDKDDYIAFPEERLSAGMRVERYDEDNFGDLMNMEMGGEPMMEGEWDELPEGMEFYGDEEAAEPPMAEQELIPMEELMTDPLEEGDADPDAPDEAAESGEEDAGTDGAAEGGAD